MTTVYLVTAGSGDTYRVERVYLDRDEAYGFAHDYNGTAPNDTVQVEEWQTGAPPGAYDGPYWRAVVGTGASQQASRSAAAHPRG